jgi:hypothetical protein
MNYIKHLTAFFERVSQDYDLNPTHISLYVALFQSWNYNRFQNPVSICRGEIMRISKIASFATYHKCIKDLDAKGYIKYEPSYNPFKGSLVHIIDLTEELKVKKNSNKTKVKNEQVNEQVIEQELNKHQTSTEQALVSSININKHIKHYKQDIEPTKNNTENNLLNDSENEEKKLREKKKNEADSTIPILEKVITFFQENNHTQIEAEKFFNYFESNGWLVGGKTKMKNWKAAAKNWMLNSNKYSKPNNSPQPNHLHTQNEKNYDEPL